MMLSRELTDSEWAEVTRCRRTAARFKWLYMVTVPLNVLLLLDPLQRLTIQLGPTVKTKMIHCHLRRTMVVHRCRGSVFIPVLLPATYTSDKVNLRNLKTSIIFPEEAFPVFLCHLVFLFYSVSPLHFRYFIAMIHNFYNLKNYICSNSLWMYWMYLLWFLFMHFSSKRVKYRQ